MSARILGTVLGGIVLALVTQDPKFAGVFTFAVTLGQLYTHWFPVTRGES